MCSRVHVCLFVCLYTYAHAHTHTCIFMSLSVSVCVCVSARCFLRGPDIKAVGDDSSEGGEQVFDPELRLLFVPRQFDTTTPLFIHFQVKYIIHTYEFGYFT